MHHPLVELSSPEPEEEDAAVFSDLESLPASPAADGAAAAADGAAAAADGAARPAAAAAAAAPPAPAGADPAAPPAGPGPALPEALAACDALLAPLPEGAAVPVAELNELRAEGLRTPAGAHAVAAAVQAALRPAIRLRGQQDAVLDALNRQRLELYRAGRSLEQARGGGLKAFRFASVDPPMVTESFVRSVGSASNRRRSRGGRLRQ